MTTPSSAYPCGGRRGKRAEVAKDVDRDEAQVEVSGNSGKTYIGGQQHRLIQRGSFLPQT